MENNLDNNKTAINQIVNRNTITFKFKEKLGQFFYYHGLNCSRHPYFLTIFTNLIFFFCCYPIIGINLFQNDFSQQYITDFDTFQDNYNIKFNILNNSTEFSFSNNKKEFNLNNFTTKRFHHKSPKWFKYDKPYAYVMQIIVQSAVIPWQKNLILMDAIRAPISQVFSIVELISNYQLHKNNKHSITLNDVCLQVAEPSLIKDDIASSYLPRYSCLILSPANVWKNDLNKFLKDSEIIKTIFNIKDTSSLESSSLKELLFGLSWMQTGIRKLYVHTRQRTINYAITLVFKEYNEEFIQKLKLEIKKKFPGPPLNKLNNSNDFENNEFLNKKIVHLYFQNQVNFFEFFPLFITYILVFLLILYSVKRIDLIKNKWIMALGSVSTCVLSLLMTIGICFWLEFNPTSNGSDILPYLVVLTSLENVFVLIRSVVSTPYDLDIKVRMAQGLSKESWPIIKLFFINFGFLLIGFITFIPLIQDISLFGIVSLSSDLFLQLMFFAPILANNICKTTKYKTHKKNLSSSKPINWTLKNNSFENQSNFINNKPSSPTKVYAIPAQDISNNISHRTQFFYFLASKRFVHKFLILIYIVWVIILLITTSSFRYDKNKINLNYENNTFNENSYFQDRLFNNFEHKDNLTFEKHQFTKNKFLVSNFLSSQHWSTLFWNYNISLSGKYITILPALHISIPVKPDKAIKIRHLSESDPQIFRQYLFLGSQQSSTDYLDDYENDNIYEKIDTINQWSKLSIIIIAFFTIIFTILIVYVLTSLYRCICTRQYAEWRSSWFKKEKFSIQNGKNLENLVMDTLPIKFKAHEQEIEFVCSSTFSQTVVSCDLAGDIKIWDILSGECLTFIKRSLFYKNNKSYSTKTNQIKNLNHQKLNSSNSDLTKNSFDINSSKKNNLIKFLDHLNNDDEKNAYNFSSIYSKVNFSNNLISNLIFNAKKNDLTFMKNYEENNLDNLAANIVISELNNQTVWCISLYNKFVLVGCSNGRFEVWHTNSGELCYYNESSTSGITVINANYNKLVVARLDGNLEIYEQELKSNIDIDYTNYILRENYVLNNKNCLERGKIQRTEQKILNYITYKYLQTLSAHKQPITCLKLNEKYMVSGGSDYLIRVYKFNQLICSCIFTLHGHFGGITCLEIDMMSNSAISGCQLGQVCVWDLKTGTCVFSLEGHQSSISEILITNLYIISSSTDNKINIWDKYSGNLVNTINQQYSICQKMIIIASNILVTIKDDELHLWDISEAKKIKVVKISGDGQFSYIQNLSLSYKGRVIVCDYGTYLCFVHFPGIMQKFD